ncbi:hypothetical protein Tco_0902929 [Tanacetum coccineum]
MEAITKPRPFKFCNIVVHNTRFKDIVTQGWQNSVSGFWMFKVVKRLKVLKKPLRKLLYDHMNLHANVKRLCIELDALGDSNTTYFHKVVKSQAARNQIDSITTINGMVVDGEQVPMAFIDHYIEFLGQQGVTSHFNSHELFCNKLTNDGANHMVRDVSDQEIREAIFAMGDNKALGPDGLTDLVSLNQSAFVPGRHISDNILLTQELMHNYHLDRVFMDTLEEFKDASGLTPSLPKSTTYFCNVLNYTKLDILNVLPFEEDKLPVKYLGVPLVLSRLLYRDCKELIEKVKRRISDWKNTSLSLAGRQLMRGFLWCQGDMRKGKAKVSWEVVCLPKKEGGLGIRRLEEIPLRGKMSWGWRRILQVWKVVRPFILYKLGDGSKASAWFDNWCTLSPLSDFISNRDIYGAGFRLSAKVKDIINNDSWSWPNEWFSKYHNLTNITIP